MYVDPTALQNKTGVSSQRLLRGKVDSCQEELRCSSQELGGEEREGDISCQMGPGN